MKYIIRIISKITGRHIHYHAKVGNWRDAQHYDYRYKRCECGDIIEYQRVAPWEDAQESGELV